MENGEHLSLEPVRVFLTGNEEIGFKAPNREELYAWTQRALCAQSYLDRPIIDHFERVARRHRNRIAVTDSDTSLSYAESGHLLDSGGHNL
jgi:hypothetical protein